MPSRNKKKSSIRGKEGNTWENYEKDPKKTPEQKAIFALYLWFNDLAISLDSFRMELDSLLLDLHEGNSKSIEYHISKQYGGTIYEILHERRLS